MKSTVQCETNVKHANYIYTTNNTNINNIMPNRSVQQNNTLVYIPVSFLGTAVVSNMNVSITYTFKDSSGLPYKGVAYFKI